ncbi:ABC transporter substrate-binding protein [Pseudomonas sp. MM211]|uniref:ABC transporter substrate-binding protein n=1 Tax=Pseudomonas sp. MM211 TaxID=2866808 RepID=UPI001CEC88A1|nr:ABC transporter substrate-binding protein [Pseudomonas sp. MM211]
MLRAALAMILLLATTAAQADGYPRTVIDLAGREVRIEAPPQRILLQDSNDLLALAILEREDPLARVVAFNNNLRGSDPSLWQLLVNRWPAAAQIPTLGFSSAGDVDIERVIRLHPDLLVVRLEARPAVESSVLGSLLERLGIPLIYVDSQDEPLRNVPRSLLLLGDVLDRQARAQAYVDAYQGKLYELQRRSRELPKPRVFIEARAGQAGSGACCHTQGDKGWGALVNALGATNLGSQLLLGDSGDVALEMLIRSKPDHYVMTGTQRLRDGVGALPFGYHADAGAVQQHLQRLLQRPGFERIRQAPNHCVHGLYHQFYNSMFNVIGVEYLAGMLWPQAFADLDPDASYRAWITRFTGLPDAPLVFSARHCGIDEATP